MNKKSFRGQPQRQPVRMAVSPIDKYLKMARSGQWPALLSALEVREERGKLAPDLVNLKALALRHTGSIDRAAACFEALLTDAPQHLSGLINYARLALSQSNGAKAQSLIERVLAIDPKNSDAHRLSVDCAALANDSATGLAFVRKAVELAPDSENAWFSLIGSYYNSGAHEEALTAVEQAMGRKFDSAFLLRLRITRARILRRCKRGEEAQAELEAILAIAPDNAEALWILGSILCDTKQISAANDLLRRAWRLAPNDEQIAGRLIHSLSITRGEQEASCLDEAHGIALDLMARGFDGRMKTILQDIQTVLQRTADLDRLEKLGDRRSLLEYWVARDSVSALHGQLSRVETLQDRLDLLAAHRRWGETVQQRAESNPLPAPSLQRSRDKIRVAIVSSDLRNHPVSYFAHPWLELYDRSRFELYCYSFYPAEPDPAQKYFASIVDSFQVIVSGTDREVAARIAHDQPDILFELAGSTQFNRLEALAWKPAPIQVSWVGYPHSAGLPSLDYILLDPYILPERSDLLLEKPFLLPHSWVCLGKMGFNDAPIQPNIPELTQGCLTFGSMNNPYKYTAATLDLWAGALRAVPDSRFLLVRPEGASQAFCANIRRAFEKRGVSSDRLAFRAIRGNHLPFYNEIDISLDTAPHVGGTTTLETLWMGVPVVTLIGASFFERLSYSNVTNAGLPDLCTRNPQDYIATATALAADRPRRQHIRHALRDTMRASPLGDLQGWVRHLEAQILNALNALNG